MLPQWSLVSVLSNTSPPAELIDVWVFNKRLGAGKLGSVTLKSMAGHPHSGSVEGEKPDWGDVVARVQMLPLRFVACCIGLGSPEEIHSTDVSYSILNSFRQRCNWKGAL